MDRYYLDELYDFSCLEDSVYFLSYYEKSYYDYLSLDALEDFFALI